KTAMMRADCLVEGNVFSQCDGETECISNKSSGNIYRRNAFMGTQGTLTLRHGNDCLVEGNVFLGGGESGTGGIRVIGQGHRIVGNAFFSLGGDVFRSAICLVNGIPDSPDNGYHQVVDVEIWNNIIVDCKEAILIGHNDVQEATLAPRGLRFEGNQVIAPKERPAVRVESVPADVVWKGNRIVGGLVGIEEVEGMRGAKLGPPVLPWIPNSDDAGARWDWLKNP
ncbi:MAG TPA: chondroitinase-B domain-containing protein, partial [Bacteroidia bacterium]|nr:chondroitinase-B domain-containing protein [Bacteroidia bacterium]